MTTFTLAGGCFWCLDAVFRNLRGVSQSISGYTGGERDNPSYELVSMGITGHAESVQVTFDEKVLPIDDLLDIYFLIHDPTTPNRQGNDIGTQYRSVMFSANDSQRKQFESAAKRAAKIWDKPLVTEIVPLTKFWPAEDYHQDYFNKNPGNGYCNIVIEPKIAKTRKQYERYFK